MSLAFIRAWKEQKVMAYCYGDCVIIKGKVTIESRLVPYWIYGAGSVLATLWYLPHVQQESYRWSSEK